MAPPNLWDLLETVGHDDVYQFLGTERDASLEELQAAAEEKYRDIHGEGAQDDQAQAGLKLAGLCMSDLFRDARSRKRHDDEILARSGADGGGAARGDPRSGTPGPTPPLGRGTLVAAAVVVGVLALAALAVEVAPSLWEPDEAVTESAEEPGLDAITSEASGEPAAGAESNGVGAPDTGAVRTDDANAPDPGSVQTGDAGVQTPAGAGAPSSVESVPATAERAAPTANRQSAAVEPAGGTLTIRAAPASRIELDGADAGTTGATGVLVLSDVQPGRHVVVARREGYTEVTSVVEVFEGRAEVIELAAAALPGRLTVTANVAGAVLRIGDAGEHPLPLNEFEMPAGSHQVTVSREGFRTVANDVEIRPGAITTLDLVLEPAPVDELLQSAAGQFAAGDYRAAAEGARSVVNMRPDAGAAHRLLGMALYARGAFEESIDPLRQAIDLGEEIELSTKHRHGGGGFREGFCSGTITLSRNAVTFRSEEEPDHGFSVTPGRMTDVEVTQSNRRSPFRVNSTVEDEQGSGGRDFDFVHRNAERTRRESNSLFMELTCRNCDASLTVQAALMDYVSQLAR